MLIDNPVGCDDLKLILERVAARARQLGGTASAIRQAAGELASEFGYTWSTDGDYVKISTRFQRVGRLFRRPFGSGGRHYVVEWYADDLTPSEVHPSARLPWRILPPGEHPFEQLLEHMRAVAPNRPGSILDETRLGRVFSLKPTRTLLGSEDFAGYVLFIFEPLASAVLECPRRGNAIYIIRGKDWERLSRLTKKEILRQPGVTRIVHTGDWFSRLMRSLRKMSQAERSSASTSARGS